MPALPVTSRIAAAIDRTAPFLKIPILSFLYPLSCTYDRLRTRIQRE